jgi:hypothetical protein
MTGWTKKWPKKEGIYWGYLAYKRNQEVLQPTLSLVRVRGPVASGGYMYVMDGRLIYEAEDWAFAFFQEAVLPKPPTKKEIRGA